MTSNAMTLIECHWQRARRFSATCAFFMPRLIRIAHFVRLERDLPRWVLGSDRLARSSSVVPVVNEPLIRTSFFDTATLVALAAQGNRQNWCEEKSNDRCVINIADVRGINI